MEIIVLFYCVFILSIYCQGSRKSNFIYTVFINLSNLSVLKNSLTSWTSRRTDFFRTNPLDAPKPKCQNGNSFLHRRDKLGNIQRWKTQNNPTQAFCENCQKRASKNINQKSNRSLTTITSQMITKITWHNYFSEDDIRILFSIIHTNYPVLCACAYHLWRHTEEAFVFSLFLLSVKFWFT